MQKYLTPVLEVLNFKDKDVILVSIPDNSYAALNIWGEGWGGIEL